MISIASLKTPKMCVVVRRAYIAGLYAIPNFGKDVLDHLPQMKDQSQATTDLISDLREPAQNTEVLVRQGYIEKV